MNNRYDAEIKTFLNNIAWLRRDRGLSREEMAARLDIDVASLEQIERGVLPDISAEVFFNIEKSFGIAPKDQFRDLSGEGDA